MTKADTSGRLAHSDGISVREATAADKKEWDKTAAHPLQSWAWGEFRSSMGIEVVRLAVHKNDTFIQGWQMTLHAIPHTPWTIGYFPKGPMLTETMTQHLARIGKKYNALFIQLEPDIRVDAHAGVALPNVRPSHRPLFTKYTFILDLTKSEQELLSAMHPKTRYNIRVATKHGVVVAQDNSEEAFETYLKLNEETTKRQGFYAHNPRYHRTLWNILHPTGIAKLFTATYQGKTIASWMIFAWNHTLYYPYGASSRENREVMAPTLLLWEIAKWGKHNGFRSFDLWGAMGPDPDQNDPWYGFHRFKEGFRPEFVTFAGSFDLIVNPALYPLYCLADSLRWSYLRMRRK